MRMAGDSLSAAAEPFMAAIARPGTSEDDVVNSMLRLQELMTRTKMSGKEVKLRQDQDSAIVLSAVRAAGRDGRTSDGLQAWDLIPQAVELTGEHRALLDASAQGLLP